MKDVKMESRGGDTQFIHKVDAYLNQFFHMKANIRQGSQIRLMIDIGGGMKFLMLICRHEMS